MRGKESVFSAPAKYKSQIRKVPGSLEAGGGEEKTKAGLKSLMGGGGGTGLAREIGAVPIVAGGGRKSGMSGKGLEGYCGEC